MTHRVSKPYGRLRYAYDYESYYDPRLHRSRQRMVRYLGRCDENGAILAPAKTTVDHVHSCFEVGPLALFYAAAQELDLRDRFEAMLGVDRTTASLLLTLSLNQIAGREPISRLAEWTVRSPLMTWEGLAPAAVTHEAFQTALMTLCRPAPGGFDNPGLELQHRLTEDWRHGSREPATAYYDITKQPYYGTECPYAALGHDGEGNLSNVVGFGLVISRDHHHPVLCRPLLGSKNDTLSVRDTVNQLKDFGFERLTLVMDRGMVSEENLKMVTGGGLRAGGDCPGVERGRV
ncbi:transposase, partial [mine drainage metagenome]